MIGSIFLSSWIFARGAFMSKISNALNMYFLLQGRGQMKVGDIAEELEVSPRMVKEYKRDLEMAGIYIGSKRGRYGGYYLESKRSLDSLCLTEEEISALKMSKETLKSGKYHYALKFEILVDKILNCQEISEDVRYYNKVTRESDEIIKKEKGIWVEINLAINRKKKVKILYKSLKKDGPEIKERLVNPYGVFDYKGATYFYAYCEKAQAIRFFKLSRIMGYRVLENTFEVIKDFDFDEILKESFGIFNDSSINLKLKIHYPMSEIVKEKQICRNQKISDIDKRTILFQATMKGYVEIKAWIMSMGQQGRGDRTLKTKGGYFKRN